MAYYTGDTLSGDLQNWNIQVLSDQWVTLALQWAVVQLTDPVNWVTNGFYTAADAAAYFSDVYLNMFITPNPIGSILIYGADPALLGSTALLCDGSSYLKTDYPQLYDVIGTTYGGDSTHFSVPDLQSRFPVGAGSTIGAASVTLGAVGGSFEHTQSLGEMPSHTHTDSGHTHGYIPAIASVQTIGPEAPAPVALPGAGFTAVGSALLTNTGGGLAMNIANPYLGVNYVIVTGLP